MTAALAQLVFALVVVAGVRWCGVKFLLVFPATAIAVLAGVIGDILLWDRAGGRYEDSDTIIFFPPRVAGSAASWYGTASALMIAVLVVAWIVVLTFALWPKGRLAASIRRIVHRIGHRNR